MVLERIYRLLSSLKGGTMIPTEVVLSPESYIGIASALSETRRSDSITESQVALYLGLDVTVRERNTDALIVKELVPNPCPVCHRQLTFLREAIARFEDDGRSLIRCQMGHRYRGQLRVFQISIREGVRETEKSVKICPECGSESLQYLGPTEMLCLDCDWDSGLEARFQPRAR